MIRRRPDVRGEQTIRLKPDTTFRMTVRLKPAPGSPQGLRYV